jgi:hypothetical protein
MYVSHTKHYGHGDFLFSWNFASFSFLLFRMSVLVKVMASGTGLLILPREQG